MEDGTTLSRWSWVQVPKELRMTIVAMVTDVVCVMGDAQALLLRSKNLCIVRASAATAATAAAAVARTE